MAADLCDPPVIIRFLAVLWLRKSYGASKPDPPSIFSKKFPKNIGITECYRLLLIRVWPVMSCDLFHSAQLCIRHITANDLQCLNKNLLRVSPQSRPDQIAGYPEALQIVALCPFDPPSDIGKVLPLVKFPHDRGAKFIGKRA